MPIAQEKGGDFEPAPAGTHVARCIRVISLGTQPGGQFAPAFKVMLMWELQDEVMEIENREVPMIVSKEYTCSLSEKANLRRDLIGWRGRDFTAEELQGFAIEKVVGQTCLVNIVHEQTQKKKTFAKVTAVTKIPKGMIIKNQVHPSVIYEIEHGQNDTFKNLPEWVRKKIMQCAEWNQSQRAPLTNTGTTHSSGAAPAPSHEPSEPEPDDVPF